MTINDVHVGKRSVDITDIELVIFQFRFNRLWAVPVELRLNQTNHHNDRIHGRLALGSEKDCYLANVPSNLLYSKYRLVDGFWEQRRQQDGKEYYIVRFTFMKKDLDEAAFPEDKLDLLEAFLKIIEHAFWDTQVYINPLFRDGQVVEDQFSLSINCAGRKPRFRDDEMKVPVTVWQRDDKGNKIGDEPLPIRPHHVMMIGEVSWMGLIPIAELDPPNMQPLLNSETFRRIVALKAKLDRLNKHDLPFEQAPSP